MGYGFMGYSMSIRWIENGLAQPSAADNEAMFKSFVPRMKQHNKKVAKQLGLTPSDVEAVLRDICFGTVDAGRSGAAYFYVFKGIVLWMGRPLPNGALHPARRKLADELDSLLEEAGVPAATFRLSRFLGSTLPLALPPPEDFPLAGFMTEAETVAANTALAACTLPARASVDAREAFDDVRAWARMAAEEKKGIVAFYH